MWAREADLWSGSAAMHGLLRRAVQMQTAKGGTSSLSPAPPRCGPAGRALGGHLVRAGANRLTGGAAEVVNDRFLRSVELLRDEVDDFAAHPFSIPAIGTLSSVDLDAPVTMLAGENGSGKSTLVEGIAVAAGFNAEGGTVNLRFGTTDEASHSGLSEALRLVRGTGRPKTGFFLRAESFFNVASALDRLGGQTLESYGGRSLHERSHGESFLALVNNRFGPRGLYILDEPEAALSVTGNLALLRRMQTLVGEGSQFIVATHSPILLGFPEAAIYLLDSEGLQPTAYEDTPQFQLTRNFLEDRERFFHHLFD